MEQNFLSLMPELQHKIIFQDWTFVKNFYRVNKYFHVLLEKDYIDDLCNKIIRKSGREYLNCKQPIKVSLCVLKISR